MMEEFVVKGVRRMVVALVAILSIAVVDYLTPTGVSTAASAGIVGVTLGYYGSKFAEAVKGYFENRGK